MNRVILFADYAVALAADQRAFAFVKVDDNAHGAQWSGVYTDGTRWGITFADDIIGAFTGAELGAADGLGGYANVVNAPATVRDAQGNVITPGWDRMP